MSPLGLLSYLESQGVQLSSHGESIHFEGPESVMTSKVQGMLRAQKSELIQLLRARHKFGYTRIMQEI